MSKKRKRGAIRNIKSEVNFEITRLELDLEYGDLSEFGKGRLDALREIKKMLI